MRQAWPTMEDQFQHSRYKQEARQLTEPVQVQIDFPQRVIGRQRATHALDEHGFRAAVAPARTFGFADELEGLVPGNVRVRVRADGFLSPDDQNVELEGQIAQGAGKMAEAYGGEDGDYWEEMVADEEEKVAERELNKRKDKKGKSRPTRSASRISSVTSARGSTGTSPTRCSSST